MASPGVRHTRKKPGEGIGTWATVIRVARFAMQDGPGIRTTVFLKGCPLRCQWCANPESYERFPQIGIKSRNCNSCAGLPGFRCVAACPVQGAIEVTETGPQIDPTVCNRCGQCTEACFSHALTLYGRVLSVDELFDTVRRDEAFYKASGGGVTVSGGEPLMQSDFVAAFFKRCKDAGMHTTLDTCGCASTASLQAVLPWTDFVEFDLKIMDNKLHRRHTSVGNTAILRNARIIAQQGTAMVFRVPLIPGITDTPDNLTRIAKFVCGTDSTIPVELLPYHRMGVGKFHELDLPFHLEACRTQSVDELKEIVNRLRVEGLRVKVEGMDLE